MELLGKTVDVWRSEKRKTPPSYESLSIAADAVIEFFEEISHHLPVEVLKFYLDDLTAIYNIKLSLSQNGEITCNLKPENKSFMLKKKSVLSALMRFLKAVWKRFIGLLKSQGRLENEQADLHN